MAFNVYVSVEKRGDFTCHSLVSLTLYSNLVKLEQKQKVQLA